MSYELHYLKQLEAEAVHIIREATAEFKNPVMLYSVGKDSSVILHLAKKAFYPGKIPFPLMHIDTCYQFTEMIEFRDKIADSGVAKEMIVQKNTSSEALAMGPDEANTDTYIYHKKTLPLLEGIKKCNFDCAFGGARRDEEKSRAKERVFSIRDGVGRWDPKNQRPELWHSYNSRLNDGENMRVFPISNWTEVDIWTYIQQEKIDIVPLYFAKKREVVIRNGNYLRLDEYVQPNPGEEVMEMMCRYRTLGCSPSTGAVPSEATTLDEIVKEILISSKSERQNRMIDQTSEAAMEKKKKEGYF